MAKHINDNPSRTFMEYRFHPRLNDESLTSDAISLMTPLTRHRGKPRITLNIPIVSAVMQSVSGPDLAIALAREGGLSFIFCSQPIETQAAMVQKVKNYKAGFVTSDSNVSESSSLQDVLDLTERTGHSTIAVTEDGGSESKLLGIITDMDYWPSDDPNTSVIDIMTPFKRLRYGTEGISLKEANDILRESKKSCIPIIDNETSRNLSSLVFKKDFIMHKSNPFECIDEHKKLRVGAGINTRDYKERVPRLVEAGVDALVIDTSDGHSVFVRDALRYVKRHFKSIPIGAGNVVTSAGFSFLADEGVDFVKVGIGGGSICITQEQKGIGRGQATAVRDVVAARDEYFKKEGVYIPVCSDGGIVHDSHILMALGFGADFVMMGRYFARFHESPPTIREVKGQKVKPYWGEGSDRAKNWQRYFTGDGKKLSFEEGVEGNVPYAGTLKDNVQKTTHILSSTMVNLGCKDISDLHDNAIIERSSSASLREGKAHDIMLSSDEVGKYENKRW